MSRKQKTTNRPDKYEINLQIFGKQYCFKLKLDKDSTAYHAAYYATHKLSEYDLYISLNFYTITNTNEITSEICEYLIDLSYESDNGVIGVKSAKNGYWQKVNVDNINKIISSDVESIIMADIRKAQQDLKVIDKFLSILDREPEIQNRITIQDIIE